MIVVSAVPVGIIHNISLDILGASTTSINGTCQDCVCALLISSAFFALNCFHDNLTCQLHSTSNRNAPFSLIRSGSSSLYFLALPAFDTLTSTDNPSTTATVTATVEYLWSFDSTFRDASSTFNGTPINNASFSNSTIAGYGSSLSFRSSMHQSVWIAQPFLPLFNRSWTFEAWIYLPNAINNSDYAIVGQCESIATDKCLHLLIRNRKLFLGFLNDDLPGVTNLTVVRWHHVASTFDSVTRNRSLYLDGVLDARHLSTNSYQGAAGALTVGETYWAYADKHFDGLIDQLSFTTRVKASQEILRDATLTLYFSFDNNSIHDQGPLNIGGSVAGNTSFVLGRRGQALQIGDVNDSYFIVQGLVLLGSDNQSYSFSIWIKPDVPQKASIIHMSSLSDGTGWCMPVIGLTNASQLIAASWSGTVVEIMGPTVPGNSWTHVAISYSLNNGMRLYVNGSLSNTSAPFAFQGSGASNYLFVGSPRAGVDCRSLSGISGQYSGAVDELQVHSRELSLSDAGKLATVLL